MAESCTQPKQWYMIMLVLNQVDLLDDVLDAWRAADVPGATVMESTGLYARQQRRHVAMRFPFERTGQWAADPGNYTLFTVVCGEEWITRCEEATESVTGSLNDPHTGILVAWPLAYGKGIRTAGHW